MKSGTLYLQTNTKLKKAVWKLTEKEGSNSPLYSDIKTSRQKIVKITKWKYFKGYPST